MDALVSSDIFIFEEFRLDRRGGGLFRCDGAGSCVPVAVGSRALDILGLLIARAGEVVSKEEIITAVWPETVVEDSNLTVQISALRRVLDQGRPRASYIQTVPGRGYRFVAAVTRPFAKARSGGSPTNNDAEHGDSGAPEPVAALPASSMPISGSPRRRTAGIAIAAAVGAGLFVAVSAWWLWPNTKVAPTPDVAAATSIPQPLVAPRLSIVVLPFTNLGGDLDQQYFVDGITDDLTTDLSRMPGTFVISRNTAFTYRSKSVDAKQIGRELGVRYVLEGSVPRSGDQVRVMPS
jgi:TolB-like protein/DNA-binding winged helix-turn-helix (wHTH) protein